MWSVPEVHRSAAGVFAITHLSYQSMPHTHSRVVVARQFALAPDAAPFVD